MVCLISRSSLSVRMSRIEAVLATLLLMSFLSAQTTISTGSIQGTVTDPAESVMAVANITITSNETGQSIHLTSTSIGTYALGSSDPGRPHRTLGIVPVTRLVAANRAAICQHWSCGKIEPRCPDAPSPLRTQNERAQPQADESQSVRWALGCVV
jgi:hypothetical protein